VLLFEIVSDYNELIISNKKIFIMNAIFNKQLYLHLCLTLTIFTFTVNHAIGQELPFEIEDHFEIHEDVDLGIKLMPEGGCENSTSDEYGFVFKRRVIEINTGAPFPPEGECGQRFGDPFLEFYPSDFNSTGAVGSLLGTPEYPWGRLYTDRISLADNGGINGASSSFYGAFITLPAGTNFIAEGDNLIDDGVIYSPQVSNSDVVVASNDKIEMRFRRNTNQSDSHFAITETGSSNVRFKVGPGGTIFMPALPSTFSGYPVVVFNPACKVKFKGFKKIIRC